MLAIREQARRVRPAEEVQDRPAGLVPPKPPTSWLRHLRTSTDKQNDQTSGLPKVAKIKTKPLRQKPDIYYESPTAVELAGPPARRTVEVKTTALVRLLNPERGTIHDLGIQQVERQFRDKEVEAQYKEFIRLLKVWSQDSAHPENDPLHDFSEYHTFTFKRVYRRVQITGKEPELKPYICILGFNTEEEVKRGHSKLASKKGQKPPLSPPWFVL
ncbi:hypothetical protein HD806DRAFT_536853 [Xylariaceae sp. AK1471]|nr:hypothetical protein HD806DRAFT_536853 [Xylariaceae sp. AK1471]